MSKRGTGRPLDGNAARLRRSSPTAVGADLKPKAIKVPERDQICSAK